MCGLRSAASAASMKRLASSPVTTGIGLIGVAMIRPPIIDNYYHLQRYNVFLKQQKKARIFVVLALHIVLNGNVSICYWSLQPEENLQTTINTAEAHEGHSEEGGGDEGDGHASECFGHIDEVELLTKTCE